MFISIKDPSKKLFIPAAGYCYPGGSNGINDNCHIWTSSGYDSFSSYALNWQRNYIEPIGTRSRLDGHPIRGVVK